MGELAHRRAARSLVIFEARLKRLEVAAVAVGDSLEEARSRRSRLVRGYVALDSTQTWLSTELWQCPVCDCYNPSGMLLRVGGESYCRFQKEQDACVFMPIGVNTQASCSFGKRQYDSHLMRNSIPEGL